MKTAFIFGILLLLRTGISVQAGGLEKPITIKECGTYPAEGYYDEIISPDYDNEKKSVFLLNRRSNSEIRVYLQNKDLDKLIPRDHLGTKFKVTLKFISQCLYRCEAYLVDVVEPIDPFDSAKPFTSKLPTERIGPSVQCEPNSVPLQPAAR